MSVRPTTETPPPQWMLSFADLLSLILTFFVLIYSMAKPIQQTNTYKRDFASLAHQESDINFSDIQVETFDTKITSEYLEITLKSKFNADPDLSDVGISSNLNRFVLSIPISKINDTNSAQIIDSLNIYNKPLYFYSENLDISKKLTEDFKEKGLQNEVGFFESRDIKDRLDIVIKM